MTLVKVHFDGWVALPRALRQKLGLAQGDALTAELVDGGILLRPAGSTAAEDAPSGNDEAAAESTEIEPAEMAAEAASLPAPARPRGRRAAAKAVLPAALKSRGRRAKPEQSA